MLDNSDNYLEYSELSESDNGESDNGSSVYYEIGRNYVYPLDETKKNLTGYPKCVDCLVPLHWRKSSNICKGVIEETISPFSLKHLALTAYVRKLASSEQEEVSKNLSYLKNVSLISTYRIRFEEDFDACFNRALKEILTDLENSNRSGQYFEYQYNLLCTNGIVRPYCTCFKKNFCACMCYCGSSRLLKYRYLFSGHTLSCVDDKIHNIFS